MPYLAQTQTTLVDVAPSVVAIVAIVAALVTTRWTNRNQRALRVADRRADALIELLRIIERRGQRIETHLDGAIAYAESHQGQTKPKVAEEPPVAEAAVASALLMAYGTPPIRSAFQTWEKTIRAIELEWEDLNYKMAGYGHWDYTSDLRRLDLELVPAQRDARRALGEAIARELNTQ